MSENDPTADNQFVVALLTLTSVLSVEFASVRTLKPAPYSIGAARDERAICRPRGLCHRAEFAEVETGKGTTRCARQADATLVHPPQR